MTLAILYVAGFAVALAVLAVLRMHALRLGAPPKASTGAILVFVGVAAIWPLVVALVVGATLLDVLEQLIEGPPRPSR